MVITGPEDLARIAVREYGRMDREIFACFHLDTKHRVMGKELLSIGTLNFSIVHCREAYKAALIAGSAAVIFCHNHPSGNTTPSVDDDLLTERLSLAGDLLGVKVLDHIIVAPGGTWYAYSEKKTHLLQKSWRVHLRSE